MATIMNPEIDYPKFGKVIQTLRKEKNVTQQAVCDAVGISTTHYSNIENGLANPSVEVLVSLINYYDISLSSAILTNGIYYKISYEIKSVFERLSDSDIIKILDVLSYAQKHLYG